MTVVIIVLTFESRIDGHARWNPASSDAVKERPSRISSFMRSNTRMFASTAMPTESTNAPMPASVRVTGTSLKIASVRIA